MTSSIRGTQAQPAVASARAILVSRPTRSWQRSGYHPVSELVGRQYTALVDGKHYRSTAQGFFFTGIKPVFKLRTDLGLETKATEDHRFLTIAHDGSESWRAVRDIKVGERLAIHTHVVMQQHVSASGHGQNKPALAIEKQAKRVRI